MAAIARQIPTPNMMQNRFPSSAHSSLLPLLLFLVAPFHAAAGPLEDALDGGVGTYVTPDGSNAAWSVFGSTVRSAVISNGQSSRISVTVNGPGIVSFYWNIDSFHVTNPQNRVFAESGIDFDEIGSIQFGFVPESLRVTDQTNQKISWTYLQHADPLQGTGTAGLDQVFFFPERKRASSDTGTDRRFGTAIAMAGRLALVGSMPRFANQSGTAHLFDVTDPLNPVERSKLKAGDGETDDLFGSSVAICGNLALVGAPNEGDMEVQTGSVYVFDLSDPFNPVELAKITPSDGEDADGFGFSVALWGHFALVGAPLTSNALGKVYLFDVADPSNPVERAILAAGDGSSGDLFGNSVALEGTTALVGAPQDEDSAEFSGSAYLFDLGDPGSPVETAKLTGVSAFDLFGSAVALSDNRALIAAPSGGSGTGAVLLYDVSDLANPVEKSRITDSDGRSGDGFGSSVSLSGDLALIGALFDEPTFITSDDAGSAHLFDVSNPDNPFERAEFTAHDIASGALYGRRSAISGNRAVIGAEFDNSEAGSAYFYDLTSLGESDPTGISPLRHTIGFDGGVYPVRINAVGAWNAASGADFATIGAVSGTGNAGIAVTVAPNPTNAARTAKITINGVEHDLFQNARPLPPGISAPGTVRFKGRSAKIRGTVSGGSPITRLAAKAGGGARAKVQGTGRFLVSVSKIKRRVTPVNLTATDSLLFTARKTVKVIQR